MLDEVWKAYKLPWPAGVANVAVIMATARNVVVKAKLTSNISGKQALRKALGGRSAYYERD